VLYVNQYSHFFPQFMKLRDDLETYMDGLDSTISEKFQQFLYFLGSIAKAGDLRLNPVNAPDWDEDQRNNFYYEREWRSICGWSFSAADVACIILPQNRLHRFMSDRKSMTLRMDERTPILPFDMIYRM